MTELTSHGERSRIRTIAAIAEFVRPSNSNHRPLRQLDSTDTAKWCDVAREQGMTGVIADAARRNNVAFSPSARASLEADTGWIAASNLRAEHQIRNLDASFSAVGVTALLLKGGALNGLIYHHPALRPMTDVDVLVREQDVPRTCEQLASLGYTPGVDLIRDDFFPTYHYEMEWLVHTPAPLRIDLHARPFRPLRLARTMPPDAFWCDEICRPGLHRPNVESLLIHLAAHAAFHGYSRLIWMYDLALLTAAFDTTIDWHRVVHRAVDWRLALPVREAFRKTSLSFGDIFPAEIMDKLRLAPVSWRDRLMLRQAPRDANHPALHVLTNLLCTPGIRFRLGYWRALMSPGKAHLAQSYPLRHVGWSWVARLLRPLRLVARLFRSPFRRTAV
jgi:hypothetical protein